MGVPKNLNRVGKIKIYIMKFNLKIWIITLTFSSFVFISCEREDLVNTPTIQNNEVKQNNFPSASIQKFTYRYKSVKYSEEEWMLKQNIDKTDFFMVGLNEDIYVFDNEIESANFENNELKILSNKLDEKLRVADCQVTGEVPVKFKITTYHKKNFDTKNFVWNHTHLVKKNNYGNLEHNIIQANFPAAASNNISSYQVVYVQANGFKNVPSGYCNDLKLRVNFYIEKKEDLYPSDVFNYNITSDFDGIGTKSNSDLSQKKLLSVLPLTNANSWDNKIKSYYIKFGFVL